MSIKAAQEKLIAIFKRRPSAARSSGGTQVHLSNGMCCEVTEGNFQMISDQPEAMGGGDEGPGPGFLGRAALGTCIAQGYAIVFARSELSFRSINVDVKGEMDMRGLLGMDEAIAAGYEHVRYVIRIESDESEEDLNAAMAIADQRSPWLYNMANAIPIEREVTVSKVS